MLYNLVIIFTVIVSILLIGIVLIQKSKGGGLSSQFGNASSMMGVRQTNTFLEKGTWTLAAIIVILSIASAYTSPTAAGPQVRTQQEQTAMPGANQYDQQDVPQLPVSDAPAADADNE